MKKAIIFGSFFAVVCIMLTVIAPDKLSMVVVGIMGVTVFAGFIFGIVPNLLYSDGFKTARGSIDKIKSVNSTNMWASITQTKPFFAQKTLDSLFEVYLTKATEQKEKGIIISDIEDVINEDALSIRSWRGVLLQIAGTLTALGLLGTFLGLVTGISGVAFSTLEDTMAGIENLLSGITTAFYTSIVGVILSILFNVAYRIVWNVMLREMQLFTEQFHLEIQPDAEEQIRAKEYLNSEEILRTLQRIQEINSKFSDTNGVSEAQEQRVMMELLEGERTGEITYAIRPLCKLSDRSVAGFAPVLKWNHSILGTIEPDSYMPIIKANGYIAKLDLAMWRSVCETVRDWKEKKFHTLPVLFDLSKTDILALDIPAVMSGLLEEFSLAPRDIGISIDAECYTACYEAARNIENDLLQKGFKVSISHFSGDFLNLEETEADEVRLDIGLSGVDADFKDIFSQAQALNVKMSADKIDAAKLLADVKKAGFTYGSGDHLYPQMTRREFEELMHYPR